MKQIKFIAAIAVMAITTVNVWQANKSTENAQALQLNNIEKLAEGDYYSYSPSYTSEGETNARNPWYMWLTQGITQDEREEETHKTVKEHVHVDNTGHAQTKNGNVYIGHNYNQDIDYEYETNIIDCPYGYTNCKRKRR